MDVARALPTLTLAAAFLVLAVIVARLSAAGDARGRGTTGPRPAARRGGGAPAPGRPYPRGRQPV
ncbi:hypothetical protein ACQI4E_27450 [Streptomyces sp. CA-252508]|uniref:hypothetical protein n=1 Tax=Streptomyces sp. CA-252508 TaxID=3418946 RepID=UPI003D93E2FC